LHLDLQKYKTCKIYVNSCLKINFKKKNGIYDFILKPYISDETWPVPISKSSVCEGIKEGSNCFISSMGFEKTHHWFRIAFVSLFSLLLLLPSQSLHSFSMLEMAYLASSLSTDVSELKMTSFSVSRHI
jgi:hypothetical protein